MVELTCKRLRSYMGLDNIESITESQFKIAVDDAKEDNLGITSDERAIRYYAAMLLAKSVDWMTVQKTADVTFNKPNPKTYNDLYNSQLRKQGVFKGFVSQEREGKK